MFENVDYSRLKRDYKKQPLIPYRERPFLEDVIYIYIELNYSKEDAAKFFGLNKDTFGNMLPKIGCPKKEYSKIMELVKKKNLEKYGVECSLSSKDIRDKGKKTIMDKYGVDNPMKSKEIRSKAEQTNLERRGKKYPTQCKEVKELMKKNNIEKYGVEYVSQRPDHYKKQKR